MGLTNEQLVGVHLALNNHRIGRHTYVEYQKDFWSIEHQGLVFVTQNMWKGSRNTSWIGPPPNPDHDYFPDTPQDSRPRHLTWVFKNGVYTGKIDDFVDKSGPSPVRVVRIWTLNPDEVVFTQRFPYIEEH